MITDSPLTFVAITDHFNVQVMEIIKSTSKKTDPDPYWILIQIRIRNNNLEYATMLPVTLLTNPSGGSFFLFLYPWCSQNEEFLYVTIYAPFTNLEETEVFMDGYDFRFYSKPYYLRSRIVFWSRVW